MPRVGATSFLSFTPPPAPPPSGLQLFPSALEENQGLKKRSKKLPETSLADDQIERWKEEQPGTSGPMGARERQGISVGRLWALGVRSARDQSAAAPPLTWTSGPVFSQRASPTKLSWLGLCSGSINSSTLPFPPRESKPHPGPSPSQTQPP